jgi:hypothetical protein
MMNSGNRIDLSSVNRLANQFVSIVRMQRNRAATDVNMVNFLKTERKTLFKEWGVNTRNVFDQRDRYGRFFNDMEANRTEFNPADFSLVGMASDNEQEEGVHGP